MDVRACTMRTLGLFSRPLAHLDAAAAPRRLPFRPLTPARNLASTRPRCTSQPDDSFDDALSAESEAKKPAWMARKSAIKEQLGGAAWNPKKRLSPDTMEGIRHLHATSPERFTLNVLASHFGISHEAVRRIVKSNYRPSDAEYEDRMARWDKRGERIWENMVEMGIKPPKKWRDMGVGRQEKGRKPVWLERKRNQVPVRQGPNEDILPTVDERGVRVRGGKRDDKPSIVDRL